MTARWLDRRVAHPGPRLALCLNEAEYLRAVRQCGISDPGPWMAAPHAQATAHYLTDSRGDQVVVVCLNDWQDRNPIEVAGLLVHESVHAWQEYTDRIGERTPGREQEAYAIQCISQELMAEFSRRMGA